MRGKGRKRTRATATTTATSQEEGSLVLSQNLGEPLASSTPTTSPKPPTPPPVLVPEIPAPAPPSTSSQCPTYSFFALVTGDEEDKKCTPPSEEPMGQDPQLNTPENEDKGKDKDGDSHMIDVEVRKGKFKTPYRALPQESDDESSSSSDDGMQSPKKKKGRRGRYPVRRRSIKPRNLFETGISIKPLSMLTEKDSSEEDEAEGPSTSRKSKDKDDEDVFFFLQSSSDDDYEDLDAELDLLEEELNANSQNQNGPARGGYKERKYKHQQRSSYSGIRGPRADAKALSLVTNCPVSVKWLVEHFEYCPGRSLPRGFVYDQYVLLCNENCLEPVNAASFGKLIRSVFPGLKTRRLGTRGNSKYHYNGVYLKATSPLMAILNLVKTQQGLSYDGNGKRGRRVRRCAENIAAEDALKGREDDFMDCSPEDYLGHKPELDEPFAILEVVGGSLPPPLGDNSISVFTQMYFSHCQALMTYFERFDLRSVMDEWKRFWRLKSNPAPEADGGTVYKDVMSRLTLFQICSLEDVQAYALKMDLMTYQHVIDILFPCLSKGMPMNMTNNLRTFLKDVEYIQNKCLQGYSKKIAEAKFTALQAFIAMINDLSRLNRGLKVAANTIRNEEHISAMHSELNRSINFTELEEELKEYKKACESSASQGLIVQFRSNLGPDAKLEVKDWINWTGAVADKLIAEVNRQLEEGEVGKKKMPFGIWQRASDQIMGAMVKGNAVSFGVFKQFLGWIDSLIKHMTKLKTGEAEKFQMPIFYYASVMKEGDGRFVDPVVFRPYFLQQQYNNLNSRNMNHDSRFYSEEAHCSTSVSNNMYYTRNEEPHCSTSTSALTPYSVSYDIGNGVCQFEIPQQPQQIEPQTPQQPQQIEQYIIPDSSGHGQLPMQLHVVEDPLTKQVFYLDTTGLDEEQLASLMRNDEEGLEGLGEGAVAGEKLGNEATNPTEPTEVKSQDQNQDQLDLKPQIGNEGEILPVKETLENEKKKSSQKENVEEMREIKKEKPDEPINEN